jgi:hypothetical protein
MSLRDRIKQFIRTLSISEGAFEDKVGMTHGHVSNIGDSLRKATLEKITAVYPDLNTSWLLTGEGEMLKTKKEKEDLPDKHPAAQGKISERLIVITPDPKLIAPGGPNAPRTVRDSKRKNQSVTTEHGGDQTQLEDPEAAFNKGPGMQLGQLPEMPGTVDFYLKIIKSQADTIRSQQETIKILVDNQGSSQH